MFENPWYWINIIALALVTFLVMLNGFLRGRWKNHVDAVLGAVWLALLILSIVLFGWLVAIYHFFGSFIFGAFTHSIAARTAARLLKR